MIPRRGRPAPAEVTRIDHASLTALYETYGPVVYRRALVLLRDADEARDAMQEVFVRLVERGGSHRGDGPLLHWIYRVTTNLCLNRLRQRRAHPVVADPAAIASLVADERPDAVDRRAVLDLLASADELTQRIAVHYYLDEMTMDEVAEVTGVSRKTAGKKLERFRKRAAAVLGGVPAAARAGRQG